MAGFHQPQHFFAAKCVFADFEAMITATIWMLLSKVSLLFFIWGFETSGFFGTVFFDAIFMAPGPSKVVGSLKKSKNRRFCFVIFSVKNASTKKNGVQLSQSSPANFGGSYFGQNMTKKNISATSVLLNYPKVCPLTKKSQNLHFGWQEKRQNRRSSLPVRRINSVKKRDPY